MRESKNTSKYGKGNQKFKDTTNYNSCASNIFLTLMQIYTRSQTGKSTNKFRFIQMTDTKSLGVFSLMSNIYLTCLQIINKQEPKQICKLAGIHGHLQLICLWMSTRSLILASITNRRHFEPESGSLRLSYASVKGLLIQFTKIIYR